MKKFVYVGFNGKQQVKPLEVLEYDGRIYAVIKTRKDCIARKSGFKYELAHVATGEHIAYLQSRKLLAAYTTLHLIEKDAEKRISVKLHELLMSGDIHVINDTYNTYQTKASIKTTKKGAKYEI